jgi:hypothetical protein
MLAALLILIGLLAEAAWFLSGTGRPLATSLGPLAGSPWLAVGGALPLLVGLLLAGRGREPGAPYATREVVLLIACAAGAGLTGALLVGVARTWAWPTLAALALGAWGESLLAVGLSVRLAVAEEKRRALFVPGLLGSALLGAAHLALVAVVAT